MKINMGMLDVQMSFLRLLSRTHWKTHFCPAACYGSSVPFMARPAVLHWFKGTQSCEQVCVCICAYCCSRWMSPIPALYFLLICLTVKEHWELPGHYQYTVDIFTGLLAGIEQQAGNYMMTGSSAAKSGENMEGEGEAITLSSSTTNAQKFRTNFNILIMVESKKI